MEEIRFRDMRPGDLDAVLLMQRAYYGDDGYPYGESSLRRTWGRLLADPELGRAWVAEGPSGLVGYLVLTVSFSLEYRGRDAFIDELYLVPSHRGQGLGPRALALAEQACRELGVTALHLEVERANLRAQALYRRQGYVDHDRFLMTRQISDPGASSL